MACIQAWKGGWMIPCADEGSLSFPGQSAEMLPVHHPRPHHCRQEHKSNDHLRDGYGCHRKIRLSSLACCRILRRRYFYLFVQFLSCPCQKSVIDFCRKATMRGKFPEQSALNYQANVFWHISTIWMLPPLGFIIMFVGMGLLY